MADATKIVVLVSTSNDSRRRTQPTPIAAQTKLTSMNLDPPLTPTCLSLGLTPTLHSPARA